MTGWSPLIGERSERVAQFPTTSLREGDGYDVVRTADRPDFHFGNLLVLHRPPAAADLPGLLATWRRELGGVGGIQRLVLSAESQDPEPPAGLTEAAAAQGLEVEVDEVLVLGAFRPREPAAPVAIRPVVTAEWPAVAALAPDVHDDRERDFRVWQHRAYRSLVERDRGRWWGAWQGGDLVGSAGVLRDAALARYQDVGVAPAHRRRGIASALVSVMAADHLTTAGPDVPLVIVAERGSSPERIYRAVGFDRATTCFTVIGPVPDS